MEAGDIELIIASSLSALKCVTRLHDNPLYICLWDILGFQTLRLTHLPLYSNSRSMSYLWRLYFLSVFIYNHMVCTSPRMS